MKRVGCGLLIWACLGCGILPAQEPAGAGPKSTALGQDDRLFTYTLSPAGTPEAYDEALAVACLQGIINRTLRACMCCRRWISVPTTGWTN